MVIYGSVIMQCIRSCIQLVNWRMEWPPFRLNPLMPPHAPRRCKPRTALQALGTYFNTLNITNSAFEVKSDLKLQGGEAFAAVG